MTLNYDVHVGAIGQLKVFMEVAWINDFLLLFDHLNMSHFQKTLHVIKV